MDETCVSIVVRIVRLNNSMGEGWWVRECDGVASSVVRWDVGRGGAVPRRCVVCAAGLAVALCWIHQGTVLVVYIYLVQIRSWGRRPCSVSQMRSVCVRRVARPSLA